MTPMRDHIVSAELADALTFTKHLHNGDPLTARTRKRPMRSERSQAASCPGIRGRER